MIPEHIQDDHAARRPRHLGPSPLFGVGPVLCGGLAVRSAILTTAGSGLRNDVKFVFGIRSHAGNLSDPLTVGGVVAQWAYWYTQRYQLLEW
jgi:hypothetical protein